MSMFHIVLVSPSRPCLSSEGLIHLMEEAGFGLVLGSVEDPKIEENVATFHPIFQDGIEPQSVEHLELADLVILFADLSPLALTAFYVGYAFGQDVPMVVFDPQNILRDVLPNLKQKVLGTCRSPDELGEVISACAEAVGNRSRSDWMSKHYPRMLALIRQACERQDDGIECKRDADR